MPRCAHSFAQNVLGVPSHLLSVEPSFQQLAKMARRPGVIGGGGYQHMKIGEATRLAMQADAPARPTASKTPVARSVTADLEAETRQLLAAIRGGGTSSKSKFMRTDSSVKTEELDPGATRRPKKKKGKKAKPVREAFVRTKTPPAVGFGISNGGRPTQYARATVELPDDDSTPRSAGSDASLESSDEDALGPVLTEPARARLRAEEEAIRELDFVAEESRVRDDADQFVPRPSMTRDELDREAARLRAAESRKLERRKIEGDVGGSRALRKRAYAEQEAAVKIQAAMRAKAARERVRKFRIEMEKAMERAWRSGQIQQEVVDPGTGDVYILNTETRTYVRTGAVSKLPALGTRPASEKAKRVRGGPAPKLEAPGRRTAADDSALAELERSVQFDASEGSAADVRADIDHSSIIPGFRMARPGGVSTSMTAPRHAAAAAPPSPPPAERVLPRIAVATPAAGSDAYPRLDSPADTMSTARSAVDPLEVPQVGTTAASLRTTVQQALK